jgi:hypothetical protein
MDLHEYSELVKLKTKIPSYPKTIWAEKSKLCVMYVEFRHMDIIKHNLNNICNVYGGGEVCLVILYSGDNEKIVLETTKNWKNVKYKKMYENNIEYQEYSRLFTNLDFWDSLSEFEHVLLNSWDSYIFRKIPTKFLKYDIVGGLCAHFYVLLNGSIINICSHKCECERCLKTPDHFLKSDNFIHWEPKWFLFNGGFMLRNVESAKKLCKTKKWSGEPDDVYFALSDLTRPTREESKEFGVQDFKYEGIPVGCHQIWLKHDKDYILKLFSQIS